MKKNNINQLVNKVLSEAASEKANSWIKRLAEEIDEKFEKIDHEDRDEFDDGENKHKSRVIGVYADIDDLDGESSDENFRTPAGFEYGELVSGHDVSEGGNVCNECGMTEELCECGYGMNEAKLDEKWKGDVKVKQTGKWAGKSVQELEKHLKTLKDKCAKAKEEGKKCPKNVKDEESEVIFAIRAKKDWPKGKGSMEEELTGNQHKIDKNKNGKIDAEDFKMLRKESKKLRMSESEVIDLIEKLVNEEKEAIGYKETKKIQKQSKNLNDEELNKIVKKLKDYVKAGSEGSYEENPKSFPKGNGEMKKMSKKAYTPSKAVEEYIENFAYSPGMENLQYDEIKPNEEWMEKNIEGSSMTGNNPEWANAVETDLGKKINAKRKKNLYGKEKDKSYNRVTQPVDEAGENSSEDSLDSIFSKLGESNEKRANLVKEEMEKMKHILGYNKKTQ